MWNHVILERGNLLHSVQRTVDILTCLTDMHRQLDNPELPSYNPKLTQLPSCSLFLCAQQRDHYQGLGKNKSGRKEEKKCTQMSFIEYRFTLSSLGELRERMLNVNMNKWAEKRAYHKYQRRGKRIKWTSVQVCIFLLVFGFNVTCCMVMTVKNGAGAEECPAGNNRIRCRIRIRNRCRHRWNLFRATSSAKLNTAERQMPPGQDFSNG